MTDPASTDAIAAAQGMTGAMGTLAGEIAGLRKYGRRSRKLIWLDIGLTVLVTGLTVIVTLLFGQVRSDHQVTAVAVRVAAVARQQSVALCLSGNKARTQQVALWEYVLHLGGPPKTTRQKQIDAAFEQHLRILFAPRDCSHIRPGSP